MSVELLDRLMENEGYEEGRWNDFEVITSIVGDYGSGYYQVYAELRKIPDEERDSQGDI